MRTVLIFTVFLFLIPTSVLADNCSGLTDCFNSARAALAASVGLGIFLTLLSVGLDFVPIVGDVKGVIEGITGRDLITGQELSAFERAMGAIPLAGRFAAAAGALATVARAADRMDDIADAARAAGRIDDVGDAARAAGRVDDVGDAARAAGRADDASDAGRAVNRADDVGGTGKAKDCNCRLGRDPVDLIQGIVVYEGMDFELPGPIPLKWSRTWYSDSNYQGILGHGTHCSYDLPLYIFPDENLVAAILPDGRRIKASLPELGKQEFVRAERITISRAENSFTIYFHDEHLTYNYQETQVNLFHAHTIVNELGFKIELQYQQDKGLNRIIDSCGRQLRIEKDDSGRVTKVVMEGATEYTFVYYGYNANNDLSVITDALEQDTKIEYENHLIIKKTDRNGQSFYWEYDDVTTGARCVHTWGDGGLLEGFMEYHPEERYNKITDSLGNKTYYYYTSDFLCHRIKDPLNNDIYIKHNEYEEIVSQTDELGNTTRYAYDNRGNIIGVSHPDNTKEEFEYNEDDWLVKAVDQENHTTYWNYDAQSKLLARTTPDGNGLSFSYNKQNLISQVSNGNGQVTKFEYDQYHNLIAMDLPDGGKASWVYNIRGEIIRATNPLGAVQNFEYDLLGRMVQLQNANNTIVNLTYDAYDDVLKAYDGEDEISFSYTPLGSLKKRVKNGVSIHFNYDTEEQLTQITNEQNETYSFKRDAKGQVIRETGFDGLEWNYTLDKAGRVVRTQRPGNRWTEYEYNRLGQVTRAEYSDGSWEAYNFDKRGLLVKAVNEQIPVVIKRDSLGRVVSEKQGPYTVKSTYDTIGKRSNIASSLGLNIDLQHNEMGLLNSISASHNFRNNARQEGDVQNTRAWNASIQRNQLGVEIERQITGGLVSKRMYDDMGNESAHEVYRNNEKVYHKAYKWDVNYKLQKIVNQLTNATTRFGYDSFGNLAWAQYEDQSYDYKMPDNGGNIYKSEGRTDRKYDKQGRLLEDGEFTYSYDDEGNLLQKSNEQEKWEYRWYGNGLLKEVIRNGEQHTLFEYDALGRRIAKIENRESDTGAEGQKTIKRWIWDSETPLHEWSYDLADRPKWIVDDNNSLYLDKDEPIPDNLVSWIFDEDSLVPTAKITNQDTYSIITDYLGTPFQMYDSQGSLVWDVEYDIYGKVHKLHKGGLEDCPFRYQGQYEDASTGLYYNRFRYFSPESGMYISQDPTRLNGSNPNFYAYVTDSNTSYDPFGLKTHMVGDMPMGDWGEKIASRYLKKQGHTILGSVQNASGHGYDLVTKTKGGVINVIEVKTSGKSWRSKANMPKWTDNNINKITGNTNGRWGNMPDYQKDLMDTIEKAKAKGKLNNKLVQINVDQRGIRIKCK